MAPCGNSTRWASAVRRLAVLVCLALALACGPRRLAAVPSDLIGHWQTHAARHRESSLEIRPDGLVLSQNGEPVNVFRIESIDWTLDDRGDSVFRFHYTAAEGYPAVFVVTRPASTSRRLRIGSSTDVWVPAS
jgi:hypothetical protein